MRSGSLPRRWRRSVAAMRNPSSSCAIPSAGHDIPGIGKSLAHVLSEVVERGSCERRDLLLENFRPPRSSSSRFRALGAKSIALIFEHYHIGTIDELERLCQEQKLRVLPRPWAPSWKRRCSARSRNTASAPAATC